MFRNPFKKLASAGAASVIKEGRGLIDELFTTKEEKIDARMKLFEMTIGDKNNARQMYMSDSWLQKAFALFFLLLWAALLYLMMKFFIFETIALEDWQIAFVNTIWGGVSMKLGTIVDFLFGGSSSGSNNIQVDKK